jgi:hypothetical protein
LLIIYIAQIQALKHLVMLLNKVACLVLPIGYVLDNFGSQEEVLISQSIYKGALPKH